MRILFISNYYPPEVNAPATRLSEHAMHWVRDGHDVEILTSAPNFPEGKVYDGYENRFRIENVDGMKVTRVPMYVTANNGIVKRTLSFISFMLSTRWYARKLQIIPDVVVATSPQFFAGVAGYLVGRYLRRPFIFEVRDLWPESIVAIGTIKRNRLIQVLERLEFFLYNNSAHIVVVTKAFKRFIQAKGIDPEKITVIPNGANLELWEKPLDQQRLDALVTQYDLKGRFVVSYIGTIGAAHRADIMLEAAEKCSDPDIVFLVVGTGALREDLDQRQKVLRLPNFLLLDKVSRNEVRYLMALTDVSLVHLKASPIFKTVIPSKIFEAMATGTPLIIGINGEAKELVDESGAGIVIQPENVEDFLGAVSTLRSRKDIYARMVCDGRSYVQAHFDRRQLAKEYSSLLMRMASP